MHHSPVLSSFDPDCGEPTLAVRSASAGEDILASDQSVVLAEHANLDMLIVKRLQRPTGFLVAGTR